jgi:hypothetical protein
LNNAPYHEQRSYVHYAPQQAGEKGETLYVIDQRPLDAGWTGLEATQGEEEQEEEGEHSRRQNPKGMLKKEGRGFRDLDKESDRGHRRTETRDQERSGTAYKVRRYYRWNGEEAGPDEPGTTVEGGWPK